jgi:hypothetical protein
MTYYDFGLYIPLVTPSLLVMSADLSKIIPPTDLTPEEKATFFQHFSCQLISYSETALRYAASECAVSPLPDAEKNERREQFERGIHDCAQQLLEKAWITCQESGSGSYTTLMIHLVWTLMIFAAGACHTLDKNVDVSTKELLELPDNDRIGSIYNTILFLDITTSKHYSARTRSFLCKLATLDEQAIASTLRDPERAVQEAQKRTEEAKAHHAGQQDSLRKVGIGLSALAGGILVGVTGGMAAPLVGAAMTTLLAWLGIGGTVAGLLASGLAGSSVVCGALFGAYGARSTANMMERHTREVRDLAILPVRKSAEETLAVRLCVSGWLTTREDVTAPWGIYEGDDTYALQWVGEPWTALLITDPGNAGSGSVGGTVGCT